MKLHIEIRPGEGGADAQDLVRVQADIYKSYFIRHKLAYSVIEDSTS